MKLRLIIPILFLFVCTALSAQSMIGMTKLEVKEKVRNDHKGFRKDNTVTNQQFNYLKYVNALRTKTWILYFTDEDICKTSKLVCDYSDFDDVVEDLSSSFKKIGESHWEYTKEHDTLQVLLTKQEWYFTVRETKKEN